MSTYELNMDGLVGSTHHYAGLSEGNIASTSNALKPSNPQAAARQGLEKMRLLHSMGLRQGLLPPQQRPNLQLLHQLGFKGTPSQQINRASKEAPELLSVCYSASSMWTANAATITASHDTEDQKLHITAANLMNNLHRHQEVHFSEKVLARIFSDTNHFVNHAALPASCGTGDEGAANHNRLCSSHAAPGINLFVYGKKALGQRSRSQEPALFPARQTLEASQAIARNHWIKKNQALFALQNPAAIDQGVFHNDVISVANEQVFLIHQEAFYHQNEVLDALRAMAEFPLQIIEISSQQLSVADAVKTYLFNSQLITLPQQQGMALIAPAECEQHSATRRCIDALLADSANPINKVCYLDLKQSMRNGGGPACLRLRVPLTDQELAAMHQGVLITDSLLDALDAWVIKHYRTELTAADLADPQLMTESLSALDELSQLLKLGSIYPFQL